MALSPNEYGNIFRNGEELKNTACSIKGNFRRRMVSSRAVVCLL